MSDSVYNRQKAPLAPTTDKDSVGGFADLDKLCSKCGVRDNNGRICKHCDQWLCRECFFEKEHYREYSQVYDLHEGV